jgi:hypothetical protein
MIVVVAHRPGFVESDEPLKRAEVQTTEDLLAVAWIRQWIEPTEPYWQTSFSWPNGPDHPAVETRKWVIPNEPPFYRWSKTKRDEYPCLMAEYDEGRKWWVIGFIREGYDELQLPIWSAKR